MRASECKSKTTLSVNLPSENGHTSAVAVGTNCYMFGGGNNSLKYSSDIIKLDTVSQTITKLSVRLPNGRKFTSAATVGTNCYVFGGSNSGGNLSDVVKVSFGYTYSYKTLLKQGDVTYETV